MESTPTQQRWRDKAKGKFGITTKSSKTSENVLLAPAHLSAASYGSLPVSISNSSVDDGAHVAGPTPANISTSIERSQLVSSVPTSVLQTLSVPEQPIASTSSLIVPSPTLDIPACSDLWAEALGKLRPDEQEIVEGLRPPQERHSSSAQQPLSECMDDILRLTREAKKKCEERSFKFKFNSREIIARDVVGKIVFWLGKFKEVGDIAVNFDPVHAALPWAGVRFILQAATADSAQMGDLLLAVEKISCLINRGTVYQKLYQPGIIVSEATENLHTSMVEMYTLVLRMIALCRRLFTKNTPARALHAIINPDEVSTMLANFENLEDQVEHEAHNCERVRSHDADSEQKELLESLREPVTRVDDGVLSLLQAVDDIERRDILDWISNVLYGANHQLVQEQRTNGTCEWLLEHQSYHEWQSESSSNILWLYGTAGTGKTFLTSKVIDDVRESLKHRPNQEAFAYFYCNRNEAERREPLSVLRAFIRQLSTITGSESSMQRDLISYVKATRLAACDLGMSNCKKLLLDFTNKYPKTTLVLDALDECEDQKRVELIEIFERLVTEAINPVKIFISSRPDGDIKERLKDRSNIGISASDNDDDISRFVKSEIVKHRRWTKMPPELQSKIVATLQDQSQGMFQWAYLQIKQLLQLQRHEDIRNRLGKLPKDLKAAYDEILNNIPEHEREIAHCAFQWVMCARKPLRTVEILPAICQDGKSKTLTPLDGLDEDMVLEFCHNLLVIDPVQHVWVPSHLSVIEYFENHFWSQSQANSLVTRVCLLVLQETLLYDREMTWQISNLDGRQILEYDEYDAYDSAFTDEDSYSDTADSVQSVPFSIETQESSMDPLEEDSFKFLSFYARHHWPLHAKLIIDEVDIFHIRAILEKFLGMPRSSSPAYQLWLDMLNLPADPSKFAPNSFLSHAERLKIGIFFPSSMAAFAFCALAFDLLLPDWHDFSWVEDDLRNENDNTLLELAVISKSVRTCRVLIEHGADVNADTGYYGSALASAVINRKLAMVKYLVNEARADVNMPLYGSAHIASALGFASLHAKINIVGFLIEGGADVDMQLMPGSYGSCLVVASYYGRPITVQYLVERGGANVNLQVQNGLYGSALVAAVIGRHIEIIEFLIKAGADVNLQVEAGYHGSALVAACIGWDIGIVRFLVEVGADINLQVEVGHYGSALVAASAEGDIETVRILVEFGADVNLRVEAGEYGSALVAASASGEIETAKFLVEVGADVNLRQEAGDYGNVLVAASAEGEIETAKFLVEAGADVNLQVEGGSWGSALVAACARGSIEIVEFLLEAGADVNMHGVTGKYRTALEAARANCQYDRHEEDPLIRLVLDHGAIE